MPLLWRQEAFNQHLLRFEVVLQDWMVEDQPNNTVYETLSKQID